MKYEIREIVEIAKKLTAMGVNITFENIGDPIAKGEILPAWIKEKILELAGQNSSYCYVDTQGEPATRDFLAEIINNRGGCRVTGDDIIFFNGLGDAVAKIFGFLKREARVIGPTPAYSTLSSAEASHSGYEHLTYQLDPDNNWMPDIEDLENKIKYNPTIAGILLINPDNPTGAVYPEPLLKKIVSLAEKYDLFIVCDETYAHIVYDDKDKTHLSQVINGVPGMSLRSISKEYPWPGARCGWLEVFNKEKDPEFKRYVRSLVDAKRLEVCSTSLPQMSIPPVYSDSRYMEHLTRRNLMFAQRAQEAYDIFSRTPGIKVVQPKGAFYMTILFEEGVLNNSQSLPIRDGTVKQFIEEITQNVLPDKRFIYYLLAARGICAVPLTGFCSDLEGFRITLLETDDEKRRRTWDNLVEGIAAYIAV